MQNCGQKYADSRLKHRGFMLEAFLVRRKKRTGVMRIGAAVQVLPHRLPPHLSPVEWHLGQQHQTSEQRQVCCMKLRPYQPPITPLPQQTITNIDTLSRTTTCFSLRDPPHENEKCKHFFNFSGFGLQTSATKN